MSVLTRITNWYKRQPAWVRRLFLGADVGLGGYLWRDPAGQEKTVSLHLAQSADKGEPLGTIGCAVLDAADPDHCERVKQ